MTCVSDLEQVGNSSIHLEGLLGDGSKDLSQCMAYSKDSINTSLCLAVSITPGGDYHPPLLVDRPKKSTKGLTRCPG